MKLNWKINPNFLADAINWIGDVFEKLSPAAFRMLSTSLPYLSPLPVAYMTANSAAEFLGMDARIAGVLVFILEGIGLWATTELVDSFVDAIRSRNKKAWGVVVFLAIVVIVYIAILIILNVVLENTVNHKGQAYSLVLTLICFLPLLSGALNGYRKVKMETKTNIQIAKEHQEELDAKLRREKDEMKIKNKLIKQGINPFTNEQFVPNERTIKNPSTNVRSPVRREKTNVSTNERSERTNGALRTFVLETIEYEVRTNRSVPGVSELARKIALATNAQNGVPNSDDGYERYKGYVSDLRKNWLQEHPEFQQ